MGLFLSMSGIVGAKKEAVESALRSFADLHSGEFRQQADKSTEESDTLVLCETGGNCSILYPSDFFDWDEASAYISAQLGTAVFSFHIHDEDLWMFDLFVNGESVARFNPLPDYWDDEISEAERESWAGDAEAVAAHVPGVSAEAVRPYLKFWTCEDEDPGKAFPDDEFGYEDCWQLCDFLKRVGLLYPVDEEGRVSGQTYEFSVPTKKR